MQGIRLTGEIAHRDAQVALWVLAEFAVAAAGGGTGAADMRDLDRRRRIRIPQPCHCAYCKESCKESMHPPRISSQNLCQEGEGTTAAGSHDSIVLTLCARFWPERV
eukprot:364062-Chlamydomonas_euryale.AAC.10